MCELYEVVIFTASMKYCADQVLDQIDTDKQIPFRLYREHCTLIKGNFVKDLSQLGRDLKDVIIVDNNPTCYMRQPCNGMPIKSWTDNKTDRELEKLIPILELFCKVDDVRDYLREVVRDNELDDKEALRLLNGEIKLEDVQKDPVAYWTICSPRKHKSPVRCQSQKGFGQVTGNLKLKPQSKPSGMNFAHKGSQIGRAHV